MSEVNKKIVREFFAAMDSKRFDDMRALLHEDHLFHLPMAKEPLDKDAHMIMNMKLQESLTDFDRHFYDQISEGDKVVSRMKLRMKHVGEFNGVPPTNEYVDLDAIHIMRIQDGLNVEEWDAVDFVPFLKALDFIPKDSKGPWD
ncbi:MAG: ester cyclase [Cycloclasticus sp.]|jgi:predicted ester cyclase|nr:MAG: protein with SnoaL-like polyketide cyclase [Cycloclasticus sp. Phe_18]MBV1913118.1 ester cyclase [Cycloclasticus sp.]MEE4291703.1 ester cyclase [Cycloclasticus sp.]